VDAVTGEVIANAVKTGEDGRDNYPWEWHLETGLIFNSMRTSAGKSEESLKACVEYIEAQASRLGILRYVGPIDPYTVTAGQFFRYGGDYYRADSDAYGEHNTYIPVLNYKEQRSEIVVAHGNTVSLYA
jgi:hypothetical protein